MYAIKECRTRPSRRTSTNYVPAVTFASRSTQPSASTQVSSFPSPLQNSTTPEMIQQLVNSALSALGVSFNTSTTFSWILDSNASNHMSYDLWLFSNLKSYSGPLHKHTVNDNTLPISAVVMYHQIYLMFVYPSVLTNHISVGELVYSNCVVSFSLFGCLV